MKREIKCAEIIVRGKVQGVFFRQNTKKMAESLGLSGWVKNEDGGHVRMVVQGDKKSIAKMITWAHQGPRYARIEKVEVNWVEPDDFEVFEVKF